MSWKEKTLAFRDLRYCEGLHRFDTKEIQHCQYWYRYRCFLLKKYQYYFLLCTVMSVNIFVWGCEITPDCSLSAVSCSVTWLQDSTAKRGEEEQSAQCKCKRSSVCVGMRLFFDEMSGKLGTAERWREYWSHPAVTDLHQSQRWSDTNAGIGVTDIWIDMPPPNNTETSATECLGGSLDAGQCWKLFTVFC